MTKINYILGEKSGIIDMVATEEFKELEGKKFSLAEMEAAQIEKLKDLSVTAKILLSAVAGAVIQHLIDKGFEPKLIFSKGFFVVKKH